MRYSSIFNIVVSTRIQS